MFCTMKSDAGRWHVVNSWTGIVLPIRRNLKGFRSEEAAVRFANRRVRKFNKTIRSLA